jgi:hypothetical protein
LPIRAGPASAPLIELTMQLIDASKAAGVEIIPGGANPDPNRKARRQAVEAQDSSVSTRPRPPGGARRLSNYRHFSMRCSLFRTAIRPAPTSAPSHLHFHQPFFLQFSCRERALLLLISVGPAVVRRRRLKFTNRAGCLLYIDKRVVRQKGAMIGALVFSCRAIIRVASLCWCIRRATSGCNQSAILAIRFGLVEVPAQYITRAQG